MKESTQQVLETDVAERQAIHRKELAFSVLLASLTFVGVLGTGWMFWSWALMLTIGIIHGEFGWLPTIGFLPSAGLAGIAMIVWHARDGQGEDE